MENYIHKYLIYPLFIGILLFTTSSHAIVIKIATLSPDGTSWMKKMRLGAEEIADRTNNRVKFKYYPGGVMGNENSVLRKMRINQLQGAAVTSGALTSYFKDADIYGLPFLFNSANEVAYVRKHMDKLILQGLEDSGLISFGLAESGFAYILSNKDVRGIDDLRQQKVWIPDTSAARDTVKAFSLQPIPLPISDVLAGLQTQLVNTVAAPPIASIALQWHTQVKYLTNMPLLYGWGSLVIAKKAFKKISPQDQTTVRQIMTRIFKEIDQQNKKDNIAALAALKNQGIKFIMPNKQQHAEWKSLAKKANEQSVKNGLNSEMAYALVNELINEFKAKHNKINN